ncbi:type II toxin-antitoxin system PemI/MazE family antitoxin [Enterococcus casseliflavus]|uniref:AbrB family transcriptional regulator n=2 Tax=Enterococcus TaxID=1350 RepID=A0ABV3M871_9ENTE|nr:MULTISPECIES: hypothetical protein [Enterococcus]EPH67438.1 toxin-antitoxin system, antitoxin component, AbrB family [Enterococcus faecium 13.SD.W.09]EPH97533.1 toxin-antitoxin system, antitoxin component, AbrB family [Enterococcus faecalis 06-MB-DW-09]MBE9894239.1 AbrB family transcriptional regulator [Enterococcus casseliflavus]MBF0013153.1 AbrB family transcriptional regulator [Enterococcus casseliflavus]MBO1094990.1 AbrB family transcriptional regulator [Enterococcus casseliflavus]
MIVLDTVKTRKQGNAVMVTLASKFEIPAGKTYFISKENDGTISLIPKIDDYFLAAKEKEFVDEEDMLAADFIVEGRQLDE